MKNTGLALLYCFVEGAAAGSAGRGCCRRFRAPAQANEDELPPPVQAKSQRPEPASRTLFHQAYSEVLHHHPVFIMEMFGVGKAYPNWQSLPASAKCNPDVAISCIRENAVAWVKLPSCVRYDEKVLAFAIRRAAEPEGIFIDPVTLTVKKERRRLVLRTRRALFVAWQRETGNIVPFSVKQDPAVLRAAIEMHFLSNFEDLLAVCSEDDFDFNDHYSSSFSDPPSRAKQNESERRAERLHRNRPKLDRLFEENPDIFELALANKLISNYGRQAPEKFRNDAGVVIKWIERKEVGWLDSKDVFRRLPLSLQTNPAVVIAAMGPVYRQLRQNERSQTRLIESFREVHASLRGNTDVVEHALKIQKWTKEGQMMMGLNSRAAWDNLVSEPAKSDSSVLLIAMSRRRDGRPEDQELIANWEEQVPENLWGDDALVRSWISDHWRVVTNEWWRTQVLEPAKSDKNIVAQVLRLQRHVIQNWAQEVPEALQQDPQIKEVAFNHRPDLLPAEERTLWENSTRSFPLRYKYMTY